jgi:peptide/nickel transport system permease protein
MTTITPAALNAPAASLAAPRRPRRHPRRGVLLRAVPAAVVLLLAVFAPLLTPHDPDTVVDSSHLAPGGTYWFGTDANGYDVFSRTLDAVRVDVLIGLGGAVGAVLLGVVSGLLIGMYESHRGPVGILARGSARVVDLFQAVPALIVALVAAALYGTSMTSLIIIISLIMAPVQARLVRTEVLKVRGDGYVDAARMAGLSELRLTLKHVLPNASWPAFEFAPVLFGGALILVAGLGFLGVGIPPPQAEWGTMIAAGASDAASGRWWGFLFPGLALMLAVCAASLLMSREKERS